MFSYDQDDEFNGKVEMSNQDVSVEINSMMYQFDDLIHSISDDDRETFFDLLTVLKGADKEIGIVLVPLILLVLRNCERSRILSEDLEKFRQSNEQILNMFMDKELKDG